MDISRKDGGGEPNQDPSSVCLGKFEGILRRLLLTAGRSGLQ
jgi:hypothetical protein